MLRMKWTRIAASLLLGLSTFIPAQAARPVGDYFSAGVLPGKSGATSALPRPAQGSFPDNSARGNQAVKWFEKFDEIVASHQPSDSERVILSRPFNQEAERVQEWTAVADKVAQRYAQVAQILKALPVPAAMPGVKDYRDLKADWFLDASGIFEDLIKPRKPAKTIEELDASLDDIKTRSESLSQTFSNLKSMDMSLRRTYRVHLPRDEDALQQYVRSK